jgi:hypothetical protein
MFQMQYVMKMENLEKLEEDLFLEHNSKDVT